MVYSDHYRFRYLETQPHLSSRQPRWLETSVQSDFKIVPLSGRSNVVADTLSRLPRNITSFQQNNDEFLERAIQRSSAPQLKHISAISFKPSELVEVARKYKEDK